MTEQRTMLISPQIAGSSSFREDLKTLFELNDEQIRKLGAFADSESGFDLLQESIDKASKNLQIDEDKLRNIFGLVGFLYNRSLTYNIDGEESAKQVCDFAKKLDIKECDSKLSAIRSLFTPKAAYDNRLWRQLAQNAIVPTLSSLIITCDLRTVCEPRTEKVIGYVPLILLAMELEDLRGDKKTVQVQLTEKSFTELLDYLKKAQGLLDKTKKEFSDKIITDDRNRK